MEAEAEDQEAEKQCRRRTAKVWNRHRLEILFMVVFH